MTTIQQTNRWGPQWASMMSIGSQCFCFALLATSSLMLSSRWRLLTGVICICVICILYLCDLYFVFVWFVFAPLSLESLMLSSKWRLLTGVICILIAIHASIIFIILSIGTPSSSWVRGLLRTMSCWERNTRPPRVRIAR